MKRKSELYISEKEALRLLTDDCSSSMVINVFDNYGNYSFPTDIVMTTPNNACGTSTIILTNKSCKNSF